MGCLQCNTYTFSTFRKYLQLTELSEEFNNFGIALFPDSFNKEDGGPLFQRIFWIHKHEYVCDCGLLALFMGDAAF